MKCDYKDCKNEGASMCIIVDVEGNDFHRCFCNYHLKKMLYDVRKHANFEEDIRFE